MHQTGLCAGLRQPLRQRRVRRRGQDHGPLHEDHHKQARLVRNFLRRRKEI